MTAMNTVVTINELSNPTAKSPSGSRSLTACSPVSTFAFAAGFLLLRPLGNHAGGHRRRGPRGTLCHVGGSGNNLTSRLDSPGYNFRPQSHRVGDWIGNSRSQVCVLRPGRPLRSTPLRRSIRRRRSPFARCVRALRGGLCGPGCSLCCPSSHLTSASGFRALPGSFDS
jgi:hypothetical protein